MNPKVKLSLPSPGLARPADVLRDSRRRPRTPRWRRSSSTSPRAPKCRPTASSSSSTGIPGIDPQYVQSKMDAGGVEQALHRHLAGRSVEERAPVPAVGVLHRHRRRLRARRAEVAVTSQRDGNDGCADVSRRVGAATRARAPRRRRWAALAPRRCRRCVVVGAVLRRPARAVGRRRVSREPTARFTLAHFDKSFDLYTTDLIFTRRDRRAVDGADRARRDRDRRLPDARREPARGRGAALALPLAAVHSVRRRRAGDAHVPRQERHAEPRADRRRADRAARPRRACSTGAASSSRSSGSRRRS